MQIKVQFSPPQLNYCMPNERVTKKMHIPCVRYGQFKPGTRNANRQSTGTGMNPDLLVVEMKDNLIGEESQCSRPDYNRPGTLRLNDRYNNSRDRRDLVVAAS
jgi:hypothetical protein